MESCVLENIEMLEQMSKNQFEGRVSHGLRKEFERVVCKHSSNQIVEWECNCDSVRNMARIILAHEPH